MLQYINDVEPDPKYVTAMNEFARSEFKQVRMQFIQTVPIHGVTQGALDAIKGIIFTETDPVSLSTAITKFMAIHGLEFDADDPLYKSIYMSLRSDDPNEKLAAMLRLEERQDADFA